MGRRKSRFNDPVSFGLTMLLLIFILVLKNIIVMTIKGSMLTLKEIVLLATVDVLFMFFIASLLSKTHAAATIDGD